MQHIYQNQFPLNVVIMAGGQGKRLRPLTNDTPKSLLKVKDKPILERLLKHLSCFGLTHLNISIGHLGDKIKDYFGEGHPYGVNINYLTEYEPSGSIGAVCRFSHWPYSDFLVINGDLLTNFNFEAFYKKFRDSNADMAVATFEYQLEIPWGILQIDDNHQITGIREKPLISRRISAGIYLFKNHLFNLFPPNQPYEGWQLVRDAIHHKKHVISVPIEGYWVDIGNVSDFEKAQQMMFGDI